MNGDTVGDSCGMVYARDCQGMLLSASNERAVSMQFRNFALHGTFF